ncbi:MAG: DUF1385 domain-containing protein [Anaerolineaceae bacterium]|nr:DUF1385 domain-containing protein [Anaerolineaceae bacterium]MBN2677050.1 DUF1385 domain-containing protein [Anaerolineaceae bacterium]
MRGKHVAAMAMRKPDGSIEVMHEELSGIYQSIIRKTPILRGLIILWDALILGTRMITISANIQSAEDEKIEGPALYGTVVFSILLAVALFFLVPAGIGQLAETFLHWNAWVGNLLEGIVRLALLILYVWAIGFMPEIRRVFGYHGAEHKTINAFEANAELKPEIVDRYTTVHPRCGTAFLLTLVLLSIIVFALLGPMPLIWRFASRILLLPVLAGLAYEFLRFSSDNIQSPIMRILIKPSLWLQKLTTREPGLDMLEVAIQAFKRMKLEEDRLAGTTPQ